VAWSSLIQSATIRDSFKNTIALNFGGTTPDTINVALYNNTGTPAQDTDPATYNVAPYNANEVTGTGWSAGGVALTSPTMTLVAGVGVQFGAGNVSVASTTLTNVRGCLIYDNTLTPKAAIMAITFGADYSTVNGTFAINWDATNGLARLTLH
jgi:hypothetical protein